jgi:(1->4)-alpha-D-glucan 1-alpha-D-glucosylmutase
LQELGIGDCYASPIFKSRPGSTHGYDVCSFEQINPTLGKAAEFEKFVAQLHAAGMGVLLDIVPNHMGNDCSNDWWMDVLEHGPESRYATWFDIDWKAKDPELTGKVLLPILEDEYGRVLESGKLRLLYEKDRLWIGYHDRRFPLSPKSRRPLENEIAKSGLAQTLKQYNGRPGVSGSFERLAQVLEQQHYRLDFWRLASEKINYRRFFDITDLVAVRMELPAVFEAAHKLVFSLIKSGQVNGLRVDHPDGLWNPKDYFQRLQRESPLTPPKALSVSEAERGKQKLYVVAEKILTGDERLPEDWAVDGTTGYEFLNRVNGLFVDQASEEVFGRLYAEFTGNHDRFEPAVQAGKRQILTISLRSDLNNLAHRLAELARGQDFSFEEVRDALREVIVHFPVYRTYVTEETQSLREEEINYINRAIAETLATSHGIEPELLRFIRGVLLLSYPKAGDPKAARFREFVMRFQQLSGPATAKGLEDTAFYNFNRLISLNEVGGDPGKFGTPVNEFHAHNSFAAEKWPHTLLATATHDTKRGEDARARLDVLSEFPGEWQEAIRRWSRLNADKKRMVKGELAPAANDEYLFYQTLIGVWPAGNSDSVLKELRERVGAYMVKAMREAKAHTSWIAPDAAYEEAVQQFVFGTLDEKGSEGFLRDFASFQRKIGFFGYFNSLSQVTLKMTSPGVPDLYQGCELWDFHLVDPDNRRPVDFALRKRMLAELKDKRRDGVELAREVLQDIESGRIKLYLTWKLLEFRTAYAELFQEGKYVPIEAPGSNADHVVAFVREWEGQKIITVVPRLTAGLMNGAERAPIGEEVWGETRLQIPGAKPGDNFRNIFTGELLGVTEGGMRMGNVLGSFPVAVLELRP